MSKRTVSPRMKKYLGIVGIWFLLLVTVFAFPMDIPIITGFAFIFFYLSGFALVVFFLIALVRRKDRHQPTAAIVFVILILFGLYHVGLRWGAWLHLLFNKGRYEAVLAKVASTRDSKERESICGDNCLVLSDQPLRVSFHYCHFFLNWNDIAYDPTGESNVDDLPPQRRLNVYFRRSRPLGGDWYLFQFAD